MLQYQFRPIDQWPGTLNRSPKRATFRSSFHQTLDLLERELGYLQAREIVIQAAVTLADLRNDGMLRANATPHHPGIILSFESKHGPLSYPCDRYDEWRDNLRAIGLSLEALRAVDRYGVTRRAEQYKGWAKLPGTVEASGFTSLEEAYQVLAAASGIVAGRHSYMDAYRAAAAKHHPDHGGDAEQFKRVQAAKDYIAHRIGV
jgi:hypothetical protein